MKAAFTFPGQGSQVVGMGKTLAEQFSQARLVFEEVDDALDEKLSSLMFEGPLEVLTLTNNAQPALMAVSLAVLRVLESQGLDIKSCVQFVAGHSLGEYSALCAARCFSLADTARLLRVRGNAMQAAVPAGEGAMAALIGLEESVVEEICQKAMHYGLCQIANDNGGGQVVISGAVAAIEAAIGLAKEVGAKRALLLPVSAPFHCALMQPAADVMAWALEDSRKSTPIVPVVSNIKVAPVTDVDEIVALLVAQITGRVRWRETIEWFGNHGVDHVFELGVGKVLTGLARRINKDIAALSITTAEDIDATLELLLG